MTVLRVAFSSTSPPMSNMMCRVRTPSGGFVYSHIPLLLLDVSTSYIFVSVTNQSVMGCMRRWLPQFPSLTHPSKVSICPQNVGVFNGYAAVGKEPLYI